MMIVLGFGSIGLNIMLLLLGSLIFSSIWFLKTILSVDQQNQCDLVAPQQSTALEVIIQRYAQGELAREKYNVQKQDLL